MDTFQPLTEDQYNGAIKAGFSPQQIISNEQQRKASSIPTTATPPTQGFMSKVGGVIQSIFPGKQVGQAIGTLGGLGITAAKEKLGFAPKGATKAYDTSAPTPLQVAGDIGQGALTVAAPEIGNGGTILGKIGANAALGAGIGATNAVAQGKGIGDVAKDTAIGGATGGLISGATEGISALTKNLPTWLAKSALPKLATKDTQYALNNVKIGSLPSIAKQSNASIGNYESQIQTVLSHPQFANVAADSDAILNKAVSTFPNSEYTDKDLIENAKNIAPNVSKLITKLDAGQANIQEVNTIRKELDRATASVYTSLNRPPESKLLGAALSNSLRDYVQTTAPQTASIFTDYSKEVGLNKAIQSALKKGETRISLKDIAAGTAGFAKNGLGGALEAIIAERLLTNPGVQIGAAKLVQGASKVLAPAGNTLLQAVKAPLIKGITD